MGVSIYHGFASIWVSEMPDRMKDFAFAAPSDVRTPISETQAKPNLKANQPHATADPVIADNLPKKRVFLTRGAMPAYEEPTSTKVTNADKSSQTNKNKVVTAETTATKESINIQNKGTSYFLVHSSYVSLENAMKTFESLKGEGFKNLVMIDARGKYRVALGIFTTEESAKAALRKYADRFDQLVIYNF